MTVVAERADAARNREAILTAATDLFDRAGVETVSMNDIAEAAGVGKGTLFRRFSSRTALIEAVLTRRAEALLRREHDTSLAVEGSSRWPRCGPIWTACSTSSGRTCRSSARSARVSRTSRCSLIGEISVADDHAAGPAAATR